MNPVKATVILEKLWDGVVPVDIEGIIRRLSIVIQKKPLARGSSGYALLELDGSRSIIVNSEDSYVRQRFTLAHELGHHALMHIKPGGSCDRDERASYGMDYYEIEANNFAAEILMPEEKLRADVGQSYTDIHKLADKYEVSYDAMYYRLKNLGFTFR